MEFEFTLGLALAPCNGLFSKFETKEEIIVCKSRFPYPSLFDRGSFGCQWVLGVPFQVMKPVLAYYIYASEK